MCNFQGFVYVQLSVICEILSEFRPVKLSEMMKEGEEVRNLDKFQLISAELLLLSSDTTCRIAI